MRCSCSTSWRTCGGDRSSWPPPAPRPRLRGARRSPHEATRAHLLGLHTACVALGRVALERALVERVPAVEVMRQRESWGRRGHLENLINAARAAGLLDQPLTDFAHALRARSNDVLHGIRGKALVEDSFVISSDARLLIERLFSPPQQI